MEINKEPYICAICNYATFNKKNLLWHNSCESHLSMVRNIKPNAISIFKEIKNLSNEERIKLLKYINDSYPTNMNDHNINHLTDFDEWYNRKYA
jgi:hypothetical protein